MHSQCLTFSQYFFGLLPSKLFACFTVHITNWGTSARSKSEFARPESFLSRTTHVGHLVVWYMMLSVGLAYMLATVFHQPYLWFISGIGVALSSQAYSDVIVGETKYHYYVLRKKWRAWRASKATATDEEKIARKPMRGAFKKMRRGKRAAKNAEKQAATNEIALEVPGATAEEEPANVIFNAPPTPLAEPENAHVNLPAQRPLTDARYAEVDPLTSEPAALAAAPAIVIQSEAAQDPAEMPAPEFGDERKASVATTATASSYDSVRTPTGSVDDLGRLGYHPEALVSVGKAQKAGSASKAFSLASALSKRLGALGSIDEHHMPATKGVERELDGEDVDAIEEFPITPGAMVVY